MATKWPKPAELRALDDAHLKESLNDAVKAHFDLRFRTASGDRTNTASESRLLRRQIARIKTILHERSKKKD
jgi:ribosomal protein L29